MQKVKIPMIGEFQLKRKKILESTALGVLFVAWVLLGTGYLLCWSGPISAIQRKLAKKQPLPASFGMPFTRRQISVNFVD